MFSHNHYVPILKTKAGERWAIEHLKQNSLAHVTPVLEIHPPRKPRKNKNKPNLPLPPPKPIADHVAEICEAIASIWPTDKVFFLDVHWLQPTVRTVKLVFDCARKNGLPVIPVALPSYGAAVLAQIGAVAHRDGRGCMLRCNPASIISPLFNFGVDQIGLPPNQMDILIDYGDSPTATLAVDVSRLPTLTQWRTLSAAAGVFPPSLKGRPQSQWFTINRSDWTSWEAEVLRAGLARKPAFGDYGTRDPQPPSDFGNPDVHLRYTKELVWHVYQNGKHRAGAAINIFGICTKLVAESFFDGAQFSAGDAAIEACAGRSDNPGGPAQWTQWCLNHHLEFVVSQLLAHPSL